MAQVEVHMTSVKSLRHSVVTEESKRQEALKLVPSDDACNHIGVNLSDPRAVVKVALVDRCIGARNHTGVHVGAKTLLIRYTHEGVAGAVERSEDCESAWPSDTPCLSALLSPSGDITPLLSRTFDDLSKIVRLSRKGPRVFHA